MENILDQSATTCNGVTGCPAGSLKLIDSIDSATCSCVQDPRLMRLVMLAAD
jgi:hypothetical protein